MEHEVLSALPLLAGCQILQWPLTYLGVSLSNKPHANPLDIVVQKIFKCMDNKKALASLWVVQFLYNFVYQVSLPSLSFISS